MINLTARDQDALAEIRTQEREEAFRAWSASPIVGYLTGALAGSTELPAVLVLLHHAFQAGHDAGGQSMLMHMLTRVFAKQGGGR